MTTIPDALQLASQYYQSKRFTQAEEIYRQIIDVDSQQSEAFYGLGSAGAATGTISECRTIFSSSLAITARSRVNT
ncbi:hypothetical protein NSTCB13_01766 [Nostoc sp. DSM 114160]